MAFVVDSSDWNFDDCGRAQISERVEGFLSAIDTILSRGEEVWIGSDLQTKEILQDFTLWDLFSPESGAGLSREICQELSAILNAARYYEDEVDGWPPGFEALNQVSIGGEELTANLDVLWAFCQRNIRSACALIGLTKRGVYPVSSNGVSHDLHWVNSEEERLGFWRDAITVQGDSFAMLERLASHAYPNLYFPASLWRAGDQFGGGYHSQSTELRKYLERLDSFGAWVFTAPPPDENFSLNQSSGTGDPSSQLVIRRFACLGLDIVPEKPNVAADNDCKRARTITLGGAELYCHWHGRLQLWANRVHIHPPVPQSGGKVIVGIMKDHLPLPGD
ncbi:hypothetical protein [Pseudomonas soli]|uniref:hypothetical protein n=1 Tax=Pseudomonas soli TaxID=1306993 RepID=UPI0039DFE5E7